MWQKKSVIISVQPEVGSYLRKAPIHMSIYSAIVRALSFQFETMQTFLSTNQSINSSIGGQMDTNVTEYFFARCA